MFCREFNSEYYTVSQKTSRTFSIVTWSRIIRF